MENSEKNNISHRAYVQKHLKTYDIVLRHGIGIMWGCSANRVLQFYNRHVSSNHLDVGVGSGYFVDRCEFPTEQPRLYLMDSNPDPLEFAAERLERYQPTCVTVNILEPIEFSDEPFRSIALCNMLHCLPGSMWAQENVLRNLGALLEDGGVLFGTSVLNVGVEHNWIGRRFLDRFNERGVLDNLQDSRSDLEGVLNACFARSDVKVVGRTALFAAYK